MHEIDNIGRETQIKLSLYLLHVVHIVNMIRCVGVFVTKR